MARGATMTTMMVVLALVACLAPARVLATDENTFMQFAYIRDASVDTSSVVHVVEGVCAGLTSAAAAFDESCHGEAKGVCESLGAECGGFVIEPADITTPEAAGVVVKVYAPDAKLFSLRGGVVFEYRGQVDATPVSESLVAEHIDQRELAEAIEAALKGSAEVAEIEAAIAAFLADEDEASARTDEEGDAMVARLSEAKRKEIQKAADKIFEKNGFIGLGFGRSRRLPTLFPRVTCSRGQLLSPASVSQAQFIPHRQPRISIGTCTGPERVSDFTCSCTEGSYVPKSCTPASFTPAVAPTFTPGAFEPIRYQPGSCSVQYVNVNKGVFGP